MKIPCLKKSGTREFQKIPDILLGNQKFSYNERVKTSLQGEISW